MSLTDLVPPPRPITKESALRYFIVSTRDGENVVGAPSSEAAADRFFAAVKNEPTEHGAIELRANIHATEAKPEDLTPYIDLLPCGYVRGGVAPDADPHSVAIDALRTSSTGDAFVYLDGRGALAVTRDASRARGALVAQFQFGEQLHPTHAARVRLARHAPPRPSF